MEKAVAEEEEDSYASGFFSRITRGTRPWRKSALLGSLPPGQPAGGIPCIIYGSNAAMFRAFYAA